MSGKKEKEIDGEEFFKMHQRDEIWVGMYKSVLIKTIERTYKRSVLRDAYISRVVQDGDDFLVKWAKRMRPLTDQELKERYGK